MWSHYDTFWPCFLSLFWSHWENWLWSCQLDVWVKYLQRFANSCFKGLVCWLGDVGLGIGMAHLSLYSEPRLNLVTIVFNSLSRALLSPIEPTSYTPVSKAFTKLFKSLKSTELVKSGWHIPKSYKCIILSPTVAVPFEKIIIIIIIIVTKKQMWLCLKQI